MTTFAVFEISREGWDALIAAAETCDPCDKLVRLMREPSVFEAPATYVPPEPKTYWCKP